MHLKVPFCPSFPTEGNPDGIHCEEMSIKMVLGYFLPDRQFSIEDIERITAKQPEKASWEMPFSIWFVDNGFELKHMTTFDFKAFKLEGIEYIRKAYGQEIADWINDNSDIASAQLQVDEFLEKVNVIDRKPTISDIEKGMVEGFLARVMVDAGTLNNLGRYVGHSVVVVGYDDKNIWFHDPGLPAFENRKVTRVAFKQAMDNFGGEMDLIRKN